MLNNIGHEKFDISIRVLLTKEFVEKLRCVLLDPKLSIQGRFSSWFRGVRNPQEEWNNFSVSGKNQASFTITFFFINLTISHSFLFRHSIGFRK